MAAARIGPLYDYFLSFIVEKATPAQILAFQIPEETANRARLLLDKQDADALTTEEMAELNEMQEVDQLVSVLKAKALTVTSDPDDRRR